MSEYQYYEFQAVERRLDEKEMRELRACSSRAQITPTCFVNDYSFGSFKGNADAWMEKYFDAYAHLANWGTHELQLRVPSGLLQMKTAELYCRDRCASVREKFGNLIFTFVSEEEGGGEWVEGGGVLSSLIPLRKLKRGSEMTNGMFAFKNIRTVQKFRISLRRLQFQPACSSATPSKMRRWRDGCRGSWRRAGIRSGSTR
jgi:hypothetical protein